MFAAGARSSSVLALATGAPSDSAGKSAGSTESSSTPSPAAAKSGVSEAERSAVASRFWSSSEISTSSIPSPTGIWLTIW